MVVALSVVFMALGGIVISSLLSGLDYHVNNSIFRGIKLSLFVPLLYSAVVYCLMFMTSPKDIIKDVKSRRHSCDSNCSCRCMVA